MVQGHDGYDSTAKSEQLLELVTSLRHHSYGEDVDMLEHSLQTAAAVRDAGDDSLTLAALFHDVGHVLSHAGQYGAPGHAQAAAAFLQQLFSPEVVEPIRLHVQAKRYLVATDPTYHDRLSAASIETLRQQGGAMDAAGAADFIAQPFARAAIQLRLADDAGKVVALDVGDVGQYQPLIRRAITKHASAGAISATWARDACRCSECCDPRNGQHLLDATDLVGWTVIAQPAAETSEDGTDGATRVTIEHTDGRVHHCVIADSKPHHTAIPAELWGAEHANHLATNMVDASGSLDRFIADLAQYGIALAHNLAPEPGAILDFVGRFGHVRTTNYGELFDVRADPEPINLAFTSTGLPLHTDNPYRDPVPTVQMLHCLRPASEGGGSIFADGFAAAQQLRQIDPIAFDVLRSTPMTFRFASPAVDLQAAVPLIDVDAAGAVRRVTINNRSMEPARRDQNPDAFYRAYGVFCELLASAEQRIEVQLDAGHVAAFDNRRVLHGRAGFVTDSHRHLQGCYADMDAVMSNARLQLRTQ